MSAPVGGCSQVNKFEQVSSNDGHYMSSLVGLGGGPLIDFRFELITEFDRESLFFRDNFLRVDVYYGDLKYQKIEQQPSYLILNFFSK